MSFRNPLLLSLLVAGSVAAQDNFVPLTPIVPPTPNAQKMTEYHAQRPNMYTGTANVSIPLYTIDFDGMPLPISISYNATGIRTNEEASEVGLGWALNATGIISRTIRDGDDLLMGGINSQRHGYVYNTRPVQFDMEFTPTSNNDQPSLNSYYNLLANAHEDTQPDIFNYNFFGHSGSFVLSQKASTGTIKVLKITQDACSILFHEFEQTFTIVTPEGYRGEFTVKELSTSFAGSTNVVPQQREACCGEDQIDYLQLQNAGRFRVPSSWYVSTITSPRSQIATFTYDLNPDGSSPYLSNSKAFGEYESITAPPSCLQTVQEHVYLKMITTDEVQVYFSMEPRYDLRKNLLFTPSSTTHLFPTSQNLKRYNAMVVTGLDPASRLSKTIQFRQNYFNVQYNKQVDGDENEVRFMRSRLDKLVIDDQEYQFFYENGTKGLPDKLTNGIDHFGFYNGNDQNTRVLPPSPVDGLFEGSLPNPVPEDTLKWRDNYKPEAGRFPDFNYAKAGLLTKVIYPTRGYTLFEYESHAYQLQDTSTVWFRERDDYNPFAGGNVGGGARIKSIKDYDFDNNLLTSKNYQYVIDPSAPHLVSSGKLMTPLYNRYARIYKEFSTGQIRGYDFVYKTQSSIPGNNAAEGKIIGYSPVHEIVNGNNASYRNSYYFENKRSRVLGYNALADGYPNLNGQAMEIRNYNSNNEVVQRTLNRDYYHVLDSIKALVYEPLQLVGGDLLNYHFPYTIKQVLVVPDTVITVTGGTPSEIREIRPDSVVDGMALQMQKISSFDLHTGLVKSEEVTNSAGETDRTEYKRAGDYDKISSGLMRFMQRETVNLLSPVIERVSKHNGVVTGATGNLYDSLNGGRLKATYAYNRGLGSFAYSAHGDAFPSPYEKRVDYTLYDPITGKLQEFTGGDGITHSFIWGYNGKLPIVHGTGVTYTDLTQAYSATAGHANFQNALRNYSTLLGKQVTTYSHIPLVGVDTITDAAGLRKTFEYDTYSRLRSVRDNDGNVLEQYDYHFRERIPTRLLSVSSHVDFQTITPDFYTEPVVPTYVKCTKGLTQRTMTITNTGEDDLHINSIDLPFGQNGPFSMPFTPGVIQPGGSVSYVITFSNSEDALSLPHGDYSGDIVIHSDATNGDGSGIFHCPVTAIYAERTCSLQVSAANGSSTLNFGTTSGSFANSYVTVTNNGNATLRIDGEAVTLLDGTTPSTSTFVVEPNTNCIDPGASAIFAVYFEPQTGGLHQYTQKLSLSTSDCGALNNVVTLTGTFQPADFSVVMGFKSDGAATSDVTIPSFTAPSTTFDVTVTNTGGYELDVDGYSVDNPAFSISPSTFSVDPHSERTITVTYTPPPLGAPYQHQVTFDAQQATFTFNTTITGGTRTLTMHAQRRSMVSVDPSKSVLFFTSQSPTQITVKNNGNDYAYFSGEGKDGNQGILYSSSPGGTPQVTSSYWNASITNASVALPPTQSTSVTIRPIQSGAPEQYIHIAYNNTPDVGDKYVDVKFFERTLGIATPTIIPSTIDQVMTGIMTLSNTSGTADTHVDAIQIDDSRFTLVSPPAFPFTIPAGQTVDLTVKYTASDFSQVTSNFTFTGDMSTGLGVKTVQVQGKRIEKRSIHISSTAVTFFQLNYRIDVTITNNGNEDVSFSDTGGNRGISYSNPNDPGSSTPASMSDWTADIDNPTVSLAPQQSRTVHIYLATAIPQREYINIVYNKLNDDGTNTIDVQASIPQISLNKTSITFPSFTSATTSSDVIINSTGNVPLQISNISATNDHFYITCGGCQFPMTLTGSMTITVNYREQSPSGNANFSQQTGYLNFDTNASNGTVFSLSAQRSRSYSLDIQNPSLTIKPPSQHPSSYIVNNGNSDVTINSIVFDPGGSGSSVFSVHYYRFGVEITPPVNYVLSSGQQIEVRVQSADGSYSGASGALIINSTATSVSPSDARIHLTRCTCL